MKLLRLIIIGIIAALLTKAAILYYMPSKQPKKETLKVVQRDDVLKQKILYEVGTNYLDKTFYGGKIVRWNKADFPIKVYIEDSPSIPYYYSKSFTDAAKAWEKESNGIVTITFTDNISKADIIFKTIKRENNIREVSKEETSTLAYTRPFFDNGELKRAEIIFFDRDLKGKMVQPYEVVNIAVHEFGHALGIWGHSDDKNSIMYAFFDPKLEKHDSYLNKQDKSTLKLLYMVTPDITNGNPELEKDTIASSILIGTENDRIDISIEHAKKEAEMKKGDYLSRLNLAVLYEEKGNYEMSLKYLKEAESLAKTNDELYSVQFALAVYYYDRKDRKNAKFYAKKAQELKDTEDVRNILKYL